MNCGKVSLSFVSFLFIDRHLFYFLYFRQSRRFTRELPAFANRIEEVLTSSVTDGRPFSSRDSTVPSREITRFTLTKFVSFSSSSSMCAQQMDTQFQKPVIFSFRIDGWPLRKPPRRQTSGHHLRHVYDAFKRSVRLGRLRFPPPRRRESL